MDKLFSCLNSPKAAPRRKHGAPRRRSQRNPHYSKRVLMLGVGGAGKTTLFRQMSTQSWSSRDIQSMKSVVQGNAVVAIRALIKGARQLAESHPQLRTSISPDSGAARSVRYVLESIKDDQPLKPTDGRHLARLWNDPCIQRTFQMRSQFGINVPDSSSYFLDRINAISEYSYVPTSSDYLRCSVRSTGISETIVELSGKPVQFLDIGGQRCERAKWLKCFHNVCAVVFVVSLGDFDETLDEDPTKYRIKESLAVFEELVNSKYCSNIPIVLVFTKIDLLSTVMKRSRLSDLFPQFTANSDPAQAVSFFKKLFLNKVMRTGPSQVNVLTCVGVDRNSANMTITTIRDIVSFSGIDALPAA